MKKSVLPGAKEEGKHMAASSSNSGARVSRGRGPATGTPRWVKVFIVVLIILVVLFVILHLTGHGFGDHMHMSFIEQWGQAL